MDARLQRRVQRYGWDLAAPAYEGLWRTQTAAAQHALLAAVAPAPGERVLDVACGTGLVAFPAARAVGAGGHVLGIDLSGQMVDAARERAAARRHEATANIGFARMDAEALDLPDASFDVVLCALGLMYMPEPEQALREMRRVLRPGGRLGLAVWGEPARCGWSALFSIVDAEVKSEVCPLFFRLGHQDTLARACAEAGFEAIVQRRVAASLAYTDADAACNAAFVGGPVALAWSRLGTAARTRARARYVAAIEPWRQGDGYGVPGEFVVVAAVASRRLEAHAESPAARA
jgi:ubiquinone/menaquinone biosynthesis C-methylase UbiE